jgi:hypothetical protein
LPPGLLVRVVRSFSNENVFSKRARVSDDECGFLKILERFLEGKWTEIFLC